MKTKNKYNTASKEKRTADGITFASIAEMHRYIKLKRLQKSKLIKNLKLQPHFLLIPKTKTEKACYYVADFQYEKNGTTIVEDVKGYRTQSYIIKRKLFKYIYPEYVFFENKV